jgi:hypothetical protein
VDVAEHFVDCEVATAWDALRYLGEGCVEFINRHRLGEVHAKPGFPAPGDIRGRGAAGQCDAFGQSAAVKLFHQLSTRRIRETQVNQRAVERVSVNRFQGFASRHDCYYLVIRIAEKCRQSASGVVVVFDQ